ncbi:Aklanonic acid methyltransferase DnrC [Microbacterium lemovicicum]|uniref:Aklanonic acid methyltransferase DnrC n=1 Tax=Microbacterium lemovicicum TaxID=1072463 RepID=A0A3S9W7F5_9MICO|nr:methyltransferase domain-containing protein [Microbacterium lemovicicum]AZS36006.1 Aklanonic acid methyltransferase DnrC [Microbacterium lemovicicum]
MAAFLRRYGVGARWYDTLSGERWVYRAGRLAGVQLLAPRPGDVVVDLGCGTGLNFLLLFEAVGPRGMIIGVDRSPDMLDRARRRVDRAGWDGQVRLLQADAVRLDPSDVVDLAGRPADALFSTYALSVIGDRQTAWNLSLETLRPEARACVVDMQPPRGTWRFLSPLARLACAAGGADITARPWRLLERVADPSTLRRSERKGGHIVVVAGDIA